MKRRDATALLIAAAAGLALISPATATPADWKDCPANRLCLWDEPNGVGKPKYFEWGARALREVSFDNRASSAANKTPNKWCLYGEDYFENKVYELEPGQQRNLPPVANNKVSSLKNC